MEVCLAPSLLCFRKQIKTTEYSCSLLVGILMVVLVKVEFFYAGLLTGFSVVIAFIIVVIAIIIMLSYVL